MPESEAVTETAAAAPPATPVKAKKAAKPKSKASKSHPKYKDMITEAIKALHERTGSSRQAIIKYIKANFKLDGGDNVIAVNVKQSLKMRIASGDIVQTKGVGASGSFKLAPKKSKVKTNPKPTKKAVKKPATKATKKSPKKIATKAKKPAAKAKKPAAKAKKPAAKKAAKPKKSPAKKKVVKKTASKAKKPAKK
ncbi:histone H1-delta-like [Argonauta hians]